MYKYLDIFINDTDTSVADVGVSSGWKRERGHAYRHGELPKEEQSGDRQDTSRHPSSAGHYYFVAGDDLLYFSFSSLCLFLKYLLILYSFTRFFGQEKRSTVVCLYLHNESSTFRVFPAID